MSNFLKYSMVASALIALAGSVYAVPTLYMSDGAGISGPIYLTSNASGTVIDAATNVDGWTLRATGTASPPASGASAQFPMLNLSITASYNGSGGTGSVLDIYFGSDGFGPTSAGFSSQLTGSVTFGTGLSVLSTNFLINGSAVPTVANPIPIGAHGVASPPGLAVDPVGGSYSATGSSGPQNLSSYSLEEVITLQGDSGGSGYFISASLNAVPEPSVAGLVIMAAGAFGMLRRRR
jgi:hypothetical protein